MKPEKFRHFLRQTLVERCKANEAYSMRAFARDLKIDNSALSKIINGKRSLGRKVIERLSYELDLAPEQIEYYLSNASEDLNDFQQITLDSFSIISDWYYYGILELIRLDEFNSDPKWIAKKLGLNINVVQEAIERLERVGLIEITNGNIIDISGGKSTNIPKSKTAYAFKKLQKQLLEKALSAVDEVDYEKRSNTSMTVAVDLEKLPEAVDEIKKFRRKMGKILGGSNKHESVYNLSIALYPLTKDL